MFVARATTPAGSSGAECVPDPLKHVFFLNGDVEFPQQTLMFAFEGFSNMSVAAPAPRIAASL
jgi:hypothetical protein